MSDVAVIVHRSLHFGAAELVKLPGQHALNRDAYSMHGECRRPLVVENRETNVSVRINMWMQRQWVFEYDLGRFQRIIGRKLEFEHKSSVL